MNKQHPYRLAYSPCPNDTFIFKALARQLIDLQGFRFNIVLEDVETLNQQAKKGVHDITKLSFAAFGRLTDAYALLRTGSALGLGCGPLLVSLPGRSLEDAKTPVIAVPGMETTACLLFRFYMDDLFPGKTITLLPMPFDGIMPAVVEKQADFGVVIHEGRFVYPSLGLEMRADLGEWWEKKTALPIPLGCIALKRDLDPVAACEIQELIGQSIDHAFLHPGLAHDYIQTHAQELDETVIRQHIRLYVNEFSRDIGRAGEEAILTFFEKGRTAGFLPKIRHPLFAC
jgi:1,4-dihydroxy-6-naphthoate synthase